MSLVEAAFDARQHNAGGFDCGIAQLNSWLRRNAGQSNRKKLSRTFVLVDDAAPETILGFYTLAMRRFLLRASLPSSLQESLPFEIPATTLARLAVSVVGANWRRFPCC